MKAKTECLFCKAPDANTFGYCKVCWNWQLKLSRSIFVDEIEDPNISGEMQRKHDTEEYLEYLLKMDKDNDKTK